MTIIRRWADVLILSAIAAALSLLWLPTIRRLDEHFAEDFAHTGIWSVSLLALVIVAWAATPLIRAGSLRVGWTRGRPMPNALRYPSVLWAVFFGSLFVGAFETSSAPAMTRNLYSKDNVGFLVTIILLAVLLSRFVEWFNTLGQEPAVPRHPTTPPWPEETTFGGPPGATLDALIAHPTALFNWA
jgi:hypothetical protein